MKIDNKQWAIKMHIPGHDKPGFMGIYYFHKDVLPSYQDGMRQCLFRTRNQARIALDSISSTWRKECKAKVVRVTVSIGEVIE